jgi:hypothetical protein
VQPTSPPVTRSWWSRLPPEKPACSGHGEKGRHDKQFCRSRSIRFARYSSASINHVTGSQ